jgi:hypothetical protein
LVHKKRKQIFAFKSDLSDQIKPVDMNGVEGADACERLAKVGDFLA